MKFRALKDRIMQNRALVAALAVAVLGLWVAGHPLVGAHAAAQAAASPAESHPSFEGFWEVIPSRKVIPRAELTPEAVARDKRMEAERAAGKVVVYASRWCNFLGVPFIMGQSPPLNIVQAQNEIGIYSEQNSAPRYVYLDGRPHPVPDQFDATTNGHSIGHWEGEELVVDTTNFSAKGHPEIPGGGLRHQTSHLVERFKLIEDSNQLVITSTWDDPKVFLKPQTYSFTYRRMPPDTYAFGDVCDASDPAPYGNSGGTADPPDKN